MRNLIVILAVLLVAGTAGNVRAQDVALGGETGFGLFAGNGTAVFLPLGANVEWNINGSLSLVGRMSGDVGLGNSSVFYICPEVRHHFSEVFEGGYIGGFLGFGPTAGAVYVALGPTGGYELMVKENFNIDINGQIGYANINGASGLHFRPTVALRYVF